MRRALHLRSWGRKETGAPKLPRIHKPLIWLIVLIRRHFPFSRALVSKGPARHDMHHPGLLTSETLARPSTELVGSEHETLEEFDSRARGELHLCEQPNEFGSVLRGVRA